MIQINHALIDRDRWRHILQHTHENTHSLSNSSLARILSGIKKKKKKKKEWTHKMIQRYHSNPQMYMLLISLAANMLN